MTKTSRNFADLLTAESRKPVSMSGSLHPKLVRALQDAIAAPTVAALKRSRGRARDDGRAWAMFVLVVMARRDPAFASSDDPAAFVRAALIGERLDPSDTESADAAAERYRRNYFRAKKSPRNWREEDVPDGVSAFYAPPPDHSEPQ